MLVRFVLGALLLGTGMVAGAWVGSREGASDSAAARDAPVSFRRGASSVATLWRDEQGRVARWERRIELLAAKIEQEAVERRRLEERIEAVATQVAELHSALPRGTDLSPAPRSVEPPDSPESAEVVSGDPLEQVAGDGGASATERALIAAGVDSTTAAEIVRRRDLLALEEIYLRNQAAREGWLDSPRFAEELAAIEGKRVSLRDEIGEDAYDRYLAALGQPNRVRVDEVLLGSPAAEAGLLPGDIVLRYGDVRIFTPNDLVDQTRGGTAGERVRLEILRQGQSIAIDVRRGPLGVRVAGSQAKPDEG